MVTFHQHGILLTAIASFITGGGAFRYLLYISKVLPPLPSNSGWWAQAIYAIVKNVSGLDPNSTINGGK